MKKYLIIILIGLSSIAAGIQVSQPYAEYKPYPIQIICQVCGYIFYNCPGEIYDNDWDSLVSCIPNNESISPIAFGFNVPFCPLHKIQPWMESKQGNKTGSLFFTNEGWMPKRRRPLT